MYTVVMVHLNHESHHPKAKLAAELGAAGVSLVAAGTAGYLAYRKHRLKDQQDIDALQARQYAKSLEIFDNANVERRLPDGRYLMAAAATRIFVASYVGAEGAITKESLLDMFTSSSEETLHISSHKLQMALSYLKDAGLIGRRPQESNPKAHGYYALPALTWAFEYEEPPAVLAEAQTNFMNEQF